MNIETGQIMPLTAEQFAIAEKAGKKLVQIEASLMTEAQRLNGAVSLHDNRSALGKLLQQERSKYLPHVGAKQRAKAAQV